MGLSPVQLIEVVVCLLLAQVEFFAGADSDDLWHYQLSIIVKF